MDTMTVVKMIRRANQDDAAVTAAMNHEDPVALAIAILDQAGYSTCTLEKVLKLLEVA